MKHIITKFLSIKILTSYLYLIYQQCRHKLHVLYNDFDIFIYLRVFQSIPYICTECYVC